MKLWHPAMRVVPVLVLVLSVVQPAWSALPIPKQQPAGPSTTSSFNDLPDSRNPIEYTSPDGQFSTTFPTGCARLQTKMNMSPDGAAGTDVRVVFVTCERAQATGEGCLINARLGVARNLSGKAAADSVMTEIGELLAGYGVTPARQTPIRRDFGPHGIVEGLDVQAHPQSGTGDVWIRGLLRDGDMYFLIAWKTAGGLFTDPEYALFFDAFRPWLD